MRNLREDLRRVAGGKSGVLRFVQYYLLDRGFRAVVLHRAAAWLAARQIRVLPEWIAARALTKTGADIRPGASIGPGLILRHPVGIVIGRGAKIGRNCTLLQGVTLGEKYSADGTHSYPTLGDEVTVCAGAVLLGGIHVGDRATVGANSVVLRDVPAGATVVGSPARPIARSGGPADAVCD